MPARSAVLLFFALGLQSALACDPASYFPCACDLRHFSINIDAIQSTLPKEQFTLFTLEDGADQWAKGKNVSEIPLYLITDKQTDGVPSLVKDKKKWYVTRRYLDSEENPTHCTPKSDQPLAKVVWDCEEHRSTCGDLSNPNVVTMPEDGWPHDWYESGLTEAPISLPKTTETHFTQYFLYDDKIERVMLAATVEKNERFRKIVCDDGGKVESCGTGCAAFTADAGGLNASKSVRIRMRFETSQTPIDLEFSTSMKIDESRNDIVDLLGKSIAPVLESNENPPMDYLVFAIAQRVYAPINQRLHDLPWRLQIKKLKPNVRNF